MVNVSPDIFMEAAMAYQKTAAMKAAIDLKLFTAIGSAARSAEEIASRTSASARGIRILCDYLVVQCFLKKTGQQYELTPVSQAFLDSRSPSYMGGVIEFVAAPELMRLFLEDPASFVRKGGSPGLSHLASDHPMWVTFAKAMVPLMAPSAAAIAVEVGAWPTKPRKVLDIAAGHGVFGIAVARAAPDAQIVAVDWDRVLAVARENAAKADITNRYRTMAGSAFEIDWGTGYDLVLLTNFLHHFNPDTCVALLQKVRRSLTPQGKTLAVEFVPNEDRVSPPMPAAFAFTMLGSTPSGNAFTLSELTEMGRAAGFKRVTVSALPPTPQSLVAFET